MTVRTRWIAALSLAALSCTARVDGTPRAPGAAPEPEPHAPDASAMPDPQAAPTNLSRGEQLDLTIPLIDGAALPLASLRGKLVIIELSATWSETWAWTEAYSLYNELLRAHGEDRLAVVLVALDRERGALSPEPGTRAAGFELGWDPQGALAARLQVAAFPAIILLDPEGAVIHAEAGGQGSTREDAVAPRVREAVAAR